MIFRDLPPEIQSHILGFCSPSDLAILSRVHTSGRDMAEYALYSRIQYRARPSRLIIPVRELKEDRSLLHTLYNNARKASMVKMFYVELVDEYFDENTLPQTYSSRNHFILAKIAEALMKMSNLVDLRILHFRMNDSDVWTGIRRISEAISGDYFKLHTLYLRYNRYFPRIVARQPHLRVLGIFFNNRVPMIKELYQGLSRCRTKPTVFGLSYGSPTVTMFPAFHHPGEALRVCQEVATSISLINWHEFFGQDGYHLSVSLLRTSEENISLLSELMGAMATCLQDYRPRANTEFSVNIHRESIQKPWWFPEFVKALALFGDTTTLNVCYPDIGSEKWFQMATDLEFCMLKNNLGRAWPSLQEIKFFCTEEPNLLMSRISNWKVIEGTSEDEELYLDSDLDSIGFDDE